MVTSNRQRFWTGLALAGVALAVVLRLLLLHAPLERDEGGYAYIGQHWLQGDWPYCETIESKPPGVFAFYAAFTAIQPSVEAIRLGMLLWSLLTAYLFYRLTRRLFDHATAGLATALLAITQTAPAYHGQSANAEMFMATFIIAALLAAVPAEGRARLWWFFTAGGLLGLAILCKPVAATDGLPLILLVLISGGSWRIRLGRLALAGAGIGLAVGLGVAIFAMVGLGREMFFWSFSYNFNYSAALTWVDRWRVLLYQMVKMGLPGREWPVLGAALLGLIALMHGHRERSWVRLFAPLWLFSAWVGVSASGRYTPHYWQQWLPPLCLMAAIGGRFCLKALEKLPGRPGWRRIPAGIVLLLMLAAPTIVQLPLYLDPTRLMRALYGNNPFLEGEMIGRYLADHTTPDETIYILGTEGEFLFHAGRRSASRYIFAYPLAAFHPDTERWQREAFAEVEAAEPRYLVAVNLEASMILNPRAPRFLFDAVGGLAGERYRHEASLISNDRFDSQLVVGDPPPRGIVEFYRRRD